MGDKSQVLALGFAPGAPEWLKVWRHMRHEFINNIQVICGYIQIGQAEKGSEYANTVAAKIQAAGQIMALGVEQVIATLVLQSLELAKAGVDLQIMVASDWDGLPWAGEAKARYLAEVVLNLIEAQMGERDPAVVEPVLYINFEGDAWPRLTAYWAGDRAHGMTLLLSGQQ
ncbi:MAG: Spo0B domain-containing protein [Heliobacteriaceae bacterium]|nr:Spo0B domain-containing protein [Heliobacteriaceae bacterium]